MKSPARIIHAGRRCGSCGSTNGSGWTRCGAWRSTTSRSGQRFAHQPELVVLEVAQPAVDQLGAPLRRRRGEVVLFDQQHREAAAGGVARDAGAVDAGADDEEIVRLPLLPDMGRSRMMTHILRSAGPSASQPRVDLRSRLRRHEARRTRMKIVPEVAALVPEMKAWRHHLHAHPETAFEETATARSSPTSCARSGSRCTRGSRRPASSACFAAAVAIAPSNAAIGLRADLDALHIHEKSGARTRRRCPARCTPAATTATRRCCSARPRRSRGARASTAPPTSSSSRPRRTRAAAA